MSLCVFCANSINILAGVNGVEAGQSILIAFSLSIHCIVQFIKGEQEASKLTLTLTLLLPFISTTLALLKYNKYPARIFPGDSFTYFAGMLLAVSSFIGQCPKTMLLFFVPQILNFLISLPQLFGIMHCPKHRVPRWIKEKDALTNSHNYTLLNALLYVMGDMHERSLTVVVMIFSIFLLAFCIFYSILFSPPSVRGG